MLFSPFQGLRHEQCRPDRDDYVTIIEDNIEPGKEHNFKKYKEKSVNSRGFVYDYHSIMHYGKTSFSKNKKVTIRPKDPAYLNVIGNRKQVTTKCNLFV